MGRELIVRILSALVLLPVVVYAIYEGGWQIKLLVGIATPLMMYEWTRFTAVDDTWGIPITAFWTAIVVFLITYPNILPEEAMLGVIIWGALFWLSGALSKRALLVWWGIGILYNGTAIFALLYIRDLVDGFWWLLWLFLAVWGTDIGAYFAGKTLGGPKLVPHVSPNKTWSGFIGGLLLGAAAATGLNHFAGLMSMEFSIALGLAAAAAAQAGDILESAVKRYFNTKDSGQVIPGHGGILDRVDALLLVLPVFALAHLIEAAGIGQ